MHASSSPHPLVGLGNRDRSTGVFHICPHRDECPDAGAARIGDYRSRLVAGREVAMVIGPGHAPTP